VDDHSTADDPQAVVREVAGERVAFYRNPRSLGAAGNFNQCIARARG
jgi:glycosyltransferase involved in cell wall biosynthesis